MTSPRTTGQSGRRWASVVLAGLGLAALIGAGAQAQFANLTGGSAPVRRDQPVFYQSDSAEYDREAEVVTLTGHVEIWQGERVLRADRVTYDRKTDVAAATGNVVLLDPGGQTLFSDYAELTGSLKDGVLRNLSAQLAENGKLVANGARRTDAKINELSRAIYSTCNVCREHPERAPLWQLRARSAVQNLETKKIEYRDAVLDIYGIPVVYLPYFTHADPSAKRASGFLVPSVGYSTRLGAFFDLPYFWAIDGQQDLELNPIIATKAGQALDLTYRRRFNSGTVTLNGSIGQESAQLQGHVFSQGQFSINDQWRWGFDINRASSVAYLRDFKLSGIADVLPSTVYVEGFGQGAYSRLDARVYQGLSTSIVNARLPYVLPNYLYSFQGTPDRLGGRTTATIDAFNVVRDQGANTQRLGTEVNWERPFQGPLGDQLSFRLNAMGGLYNTHQLDQQPSWGPRNAASAAQAMPAASLSWRLPLVHQGDWGSQTIEPIVQLVARPNGPSYPIGVRPDGTRFVNSLISNEDSLAVEFTDATLFQLNRFSGLDRLEGGLRADVALRGSWDFGQGSSIQAIVGQSYRAKKDRAFPVGSGLENTASDIVAGLNVTPNSWLDLSSHARFDHRSGRLRFADTVASVGPSWLHGTAGYLYSTTDPYFYYDNPPNGVLPNAPRNEIMLSATTHIDRYTLGGYLQRDIQSRRMVLVGASGGYEDECFALSANYFRRYTSLNNDSGATTFLLQLTFKTVGTFGFHAL